MDVENITNYRRRVLSVSVRPMTDAVAEFAVTGVAFLWHQAGFGRCRSAHPGMQGPSTLGQLRSPKSEDRSAPEVRCMAAVLLLVGQG